jgi:hypothetical protein
MTGWCIAKCVRKLCNDVVVWEVARGSRKGELVVQHVPWIREVNIDSLWLVHTDERLVLQ